MALFRMLQKKMCENKVGAIMVLENGSLGITGEGPYKQI